MGKDFRIIMKTTNPFIGLFPFMIPWLTSSWDYQTFKLNGSLYVHYPRISLESYARAKFFTLCTKYEVKKMEKLKENDKVSSKDLMSAKKM